VFNETYIAVVNEILDNLEENGIYALLDVHQDVISSYYCLYDGAPTWEIDMAEPPAHAFPWPLSWDGTDPCPSTRARGKN
jgi:endoglycosylceramidase